MGGGLPIILHWLFVRGQNTNKKVIFVKEIGLTRSSFSLIHNQTNICLFYLVNSNELIDISLRLINLFCLVISTDKSFTPKNEGHNIAIDGEHSFLQVVKICNLLGYTFVPSFNHKFLRSKYCTCTLWLGSANSRLSRISVEKTECGTTQSCLSTILEIHQCQLWPDGDRLQR